MQRPRGDRHEEQRFGLDVRQLVRVVRRERERQRADRGRIAASRQDEAQPIGAESIQHRQGDEQDVVGQHRRRAEPLQRRRQPGEAEQRFRQPKGPRHRRERGRIPIRVGKRDLLGVPPQDPRVQQRITKVAGDR